MFNKEVGLYSAMFSHNQLKVYFIPAEVISVVLDGFQSYSGHKRLVSGHKRVRILHF